ncbi:hypothetical protein D3C86_1878930 [compost metagenome]
MPQWLLPMVSHSAGQKEDPERILQRLRQTGYLIILLVRIGQQLLGVLNVADSISMRRVVSKVARHAQIAARRLE